MTNPTDYQPISGETWAAIKDVIAALKASKAEHDAPLPPDWEDLLDHWTRLIVGATGHVQPFPVTEHFLHLLQMFIDDAPPPEEVAGGSRLVLDWAQECIDNARPFGLEPTHGATDKKCWLVIDGNRYEEG